MGKWAGAAAGLIAAVTLLRVALRMRARRRKNRTIDQEELNQWFRRHR